MSPSQKHTRRYPPTACTFAVAIGERTPPSAPHRRPHPRERRAPRPVMPHPSSHFALRGASLVRDISQLRSLRSLPRRGSSKVLSLRKYAKHEEGDGRAGHVGDGSVCRQRLCGGTLAASGDCDPHAGGGNLSLASGDQSCPRHAAEASLGADGRARWVRPRGRARPRKAHTTSDALRRVRTSKEGAHLQRSAANECCTHPRKREDAPRV